MFNILVLILALNAFAEQSSFEIIGGGITYHIMDQGGAQYYTQKISNDGRLIFNPTLGFGIVHKIETPEYVTDQYASLKVFTGANSVGKPMNGVIMGYGWKYGPLYFGPVLGGYFQDDKEFEDQGVIPFRLFEVNHVGFVPILGAELDMKFNINKDCYLKLNNLISPIVTNTSLSFGFQL